MKSLRYGLLGVLTLLFVSPLLFKTRQEAGRTPPTWIPQTPTFDAYDQIVNAAGTPVFRWFANSMIAASLNALLIVFTSALAAYALARLEFRAVGSCSA